jgi:tight adherence protein B
MKVLRTFIGMGVGALVLGLPTPALAGVELKGVDVSGYPTVRATVVTDRLTSQPPTMTENGRPAAGLSAENLGRAKSIVVAIDRSRSMVGTPFEDAVAAAREFIAAKPLQDRIQVVVFGRRAESLTSFSTATIDADAALRTLEVEATAGTALYDALVLASTSAATEELPARVVILLTDGDDASSQSDLAGAIESARDAGVTVYAIGIEGNRFDPGVLQQMARETGGSYYGTASTDALTDVYASIGEELRRTWQVEFVSAALPGERASFRAVAEGEASPAVTSEIPGSTTVVPKAEPSPLLPAPLLESRFGALVVGLVVGLVLLAAAFFAFSGKKGAWLTRRLEPHVSETHHVKISGAGERLALAAGLFRATERTFGHMRPWRHVGSLLERADLPVRTVEFFYIASGSSLLVGIVAAAFGPPTLVVLGGLVAGGFIPYAVVSFKARRRLRAFENQLPDLLITMAASLKAGHSFRQGMQAVIDEDQEPASKEFKRVLAETRLGRPMDAALSEMARRIGSKNLEFVITAVTIQRQIGGSLASIFDMVADTVRDRQQFARKIKGLTAMGRMSAYVLIGLPFFVLGVITLVNSEYMSPLWHSSTGHKLLIVMLVMMSIGSLILRKIVSFRG